MRNQISIFDNTERDLSKLSIKLIQEFEEISLQRNPLGYVVGYSGGKDSDVLVHLFIESGVKFIIIHNHTTLDAPETVYYIRKKFKEWRELGIDCRIYYPEKSFEQLCLEKNMLPTRTIRFCCAELKEKDIPELKFATHSFGVRKAESVKRLKYRDSIETRNRADYTDIKMYHFDNTEEIKNTSSCYTNNYFIVNPLAYWSNDYLWDYIEKNNIEINPLYKLGFKRVGCIGCPMAGKARFKEFLMYPKYEERFKRIANKLFEKWESMGKNVCNFQCGEEIFNWWITG